MMNKAQADIAYGFTTIRRADPAYYAFRLMNNVLGQYALGGRLGDSIRERQGMAYYVFSAFDPNVVEGPLTIRAGVSPANVDRAVAVDRRGARPPRRGRRHAEGAGRIAAVPDRLDAARARNQRRHRGVSPDGGVLRPRHSTTTLRMPDLLRAVTLDEVNAAARRVLDPVACGDRHRRTVRRIVT